MARSGKPLAGFVHSKCRWCWLRSCWICSTRRLVLSLGNNRVVTLRWNCASLLIKTSTAVASYIEIIIVFLQYKQCAEAALTVCQRCRKDNRLLIIFRDDFTFTWNEIEVLQPAAEPLYYLCSSRTVSADTEAAARFKYFHNRSDRAEAALRCVHTYAHARARGLCTGTYVLPAGLGKRTCCLWVVKTALWILL